MKTIEALVNRVAHEPASSAFSGQVTAALDGQPGVGLRQAVDLQSRRARGVFFTSAAMAKRALRPGFLSFNEDSIIVDPACGAGDLLLACARQLPKVHDFASTVTLWSRQLYGRDLYNEFAQAAKLRLALAAWQRYPGRFEVPLSRAALFPGISTGAASRLRDGPTRLFVAFKGADREGLASRPPLHRVGDVATRVGLTMISKKTFLWLRTCRSDTLALFREPLSDQFC